MSECHRANDQSQNRDRDLESMRPVQPTPGTVRVSSGEIASR